MSKDTEAPCGFVVDPALPADGPMGTRSLAFNYMDAVERGLAELAGQGDGESTVGGKDALLWSLSYVASMAKALVQHELEKK